MASVASRASVSISSTTTPKEIATPSLVAGRDLLLFVHGPSASLSTTGITNQSGTPVASVLVGRANSTAAAIEVYRIRIPTVPFSALRVTTAPTILLQVAYVEVNDSDLTTPIDFFFSEVLNPGATSMAVGPTTNAIDGSDELAIAMVALHNNVGAFNAWAGGFTSQGIDQTRISLATRTVSPTAGALTATASWVNTLQGVGVIVVVRDSPVLAPLVVDVGPTISGALAGVAITRTAVVTNAQVGEQFSYVWTLRSKPAASVRTSEDIAGRLTASITFTPDVDTDDAPFVLRCTVVRI